MSTIPFLDLTKRPPRSPRIRLGGYVILPRMLDKGRATLAGKNGEYHYHCPLDKHFTKFAGIDADKLLAELKKGKGDGEILEWIQSHASQNPTLLQILDWSAYQDNRAPSDLDSRKFFNEYHSNIAPKRTDVTSWFDVLDIDDFVSFGGKA